MRDIFINLLEKLITVLVVIMMIGVVVAAGGALFVPQPGVPGPLMALAILIGGGIYVVVMGGFMYLGLGIYQNTRRTAEAIEQLAAR
ncbi:hypothetical protein [Pararhodobacter zhoushanensis]|uniref:Uncharacterized protein n=1 Tax=Pararhodobacter zhoushanensis TaxID=2479545 RepID=A0ABT3H3M5_9RHOB|nr:hypothetical protein [Pararhodobacter zhoushanensis]MCW1934389.1 hypothetical protein [Pararhodobacter zhoushanensis]